MLAQKLKIFFVPCLQNQLRPYSLRYVTLAFVVVLTLLIELALFLYVNVAFKSNALIGNIITGIQSSVAQILPEAIVSETNDFRLANNLSPLSTSPLLSQAAKMKADDMAAKGYFSHIGPLGEEPWTWITKAGYDYSYAGENLAVNFFDAQDLVQAWENSPEHRGNLLNPEFREIGIGVARGQYDGHDTIYVVQFFGTLAENFTPNLAVNPVVTANPQPSHKPAVTPDEKNILIAVSRGVGGKIAATSTIASSSVGSNVLGSSSAAGVKKTAGPFAGLSFLQKITVSPRHMVDYVMIVLLAYVTLVLLIPMIAVYRNHQSASILLRIKEIIMLFKRSIISSAVTLSVVGAVMVLNYIMLRLGISLSEGGSSVPYFIKKM